MLLGKSGSGIFHAETVCKPTRKRFFLKFGVGHLVVFGLKETGEEDEHMLWESLVKLFTFTLIDGQIN